MIQPELHQIISQLLEQTRAGKVPWTEVPQTTRSRIRAYRLVLPNSSVNVSRTSEEEMVFAILNDEGSIAVQESADYSDPIYFDLRDLFDIVDRQVRKVDRSLEEIQAWLEANRRGRRLP